MEAGNVLVFWMNCCRCGVAIMECWLLRVSGNTASWRATIAGLSHRQPERRYIRELSLGSGRPLFITRVQKVIRKSWRRYLVFIATNLPVVIFPLVIGQLYSLWISFEASKMSWDE